MSTLGFEVEWFDTVADSLQKLYLKYFLGDHTIELIHAGKNTTFLKRIFYPQVTLADLFIGNSVTVFQRLLIIKNYANSATEKYMSEREVHIVCTLNKSNYTILGPLGSLARQMKMRWGRVTTTSNAMESCGLFAEAGDFVVEIVAAAGSDPDGFVRDARALSGALTINIADPSSVAVFMREAMPAQFGDNVSLCIIKPHVMRVRRQEEVINSIIKHGGFAIAGVMSVHLHSDMADEFFKVYKRLCPSYSALLEQMCGGPCIALIIEPSNENTSSLDGGHIVTEFREFCGPNNCELAATLRPKSLRALVGVPGIKTNIIENGIHCTDLPDDGFMECSYFFNTLCAIKNQSRK